MLAPLLTNDRAAREWTWICSQAGEPAALAAIARLGNRKPFPLNIARALGLELPSELATAPAVSQEEGRRRAAELRSLLRKR